MMLMSIPIELFLSGLALGVGPCALLCLPILLPYVAGTREGLAESLKATFAFSLSRLSAYTLMGLVAGFAGELLIGFLGRTEFSFYIWTIGGFLISLLGVLILLGGESKIAFCRLLMRHTIDDSLKSMGLLGFIVGLTPCAPLYGILTYIALGVKAPLEGAFYALCFGIGASVTTPITVLGIVAGVAPRLIFKNPRIQYIFKRSCGFMLLLLGAKTIVLQILGSQQYW